MKKSLCIFLSALSFFYYLWLGIHNSFHMSVLPFWLLLSMLFLAIVFLFPKLSATARRVLGLCLVAGTAFFLLIEGCILRGMAGNCPENLDYIIVLGAGLNGEKPSSVLEQRLESALAYLQTHPQTNVVVSGGQGANEAISEAESMKNWLLEKGISSSSILVEDRSTTTAENMRYSFSCIAIEEQSANSGLSSDSVFHRHSDMADSPPSLKIGIATSNFHVFRSLCIANKVQKENGNCAGNYQFFGIAADFPPLLLPHYMVREFFTVCVDAALGNIAKP